MSELSTFSELLVALSEVLRVKTSYGENAKEFAERVPPNF